MINNKGKIIEKEIDMGLSSSQARLLHLTSRMHQIEHKAAKVQAEKLQMANSTAKVRQEYLDALEETRIQYGRIGSNGAVEFSNVNANILQNGVIPEYSGEHSAASLFLQRNNGKIVITPAVAEAFNIPATGQMNLSMDQYLTNLGLNKTIIHATRVEDIEGTVASFTPIANSGYVQCQHIETDHYNYQNAVSCTSVPHTETVYTPFESGTTYLISNAADLQKFYQSVSAGCLDGVTNVCFELGSDINMTGISYTPVDLDGVRFDGNGHTITGLTQPLFNNISDSTITNLNIVNPSISDVNGTVGCIARTVSGDVYTEISNITITGLNMTGQQAGGLVGEYSLASGNGNLLSIKNCRIENSTICGTSVAGGLVGSQSSDGFLTDDNCYVQANVYIQGYPSSPDNGLLLGAQAGSGNIFHINYDVNAINGGTTAVGPGIPSTGTGFDATTCGCFSEIAFGTVMNNVGPQQVTTMNVTIPSINADGSGAFSSNILVLLEMVGVYDTHTEQPSGIKTSVQNYLKNPSASEMQELYYLNNYVTDFISANANNTPATPNAFVTALLADINNGVKTNTADYRTGDVAFGTVGFNTNPNQQAWVSHTVTVDYEAGELTIPNIDTIKAGLTAAFTKAEFNITEDKINEFFALYDTNDNADKAYLAYINSVICNYASSNSTILLNSLRSAVQSGSKISQLPSNIDNAAHYNVSMNCTVQDVHPIPKTRIVETDEIIREYWDTDIPEVAQGMALYFLAKRGVDILTDVQAESEEYLTNAIASGECVLTAFDPSNVQVLLNMPLDQLENINDSQYAELLGIVNTSVATESNLQEVQYSENIKKAEAKYEADMKKIDKKERKYDRDLAALDNERNAIKQEMDTLKSVAKDNVERTFKLFS